MAAVPSLTKRSVLRALKWINAAWLLGVPRQGAWAQPGCDAPADSDWLKPAAASTERALDPGLIRPVGRALPRAIALLATRSSVVLTAADVVAMTGVPTVPPPQDRTLRPYLVRAVFPTDKPVLTVRWSGANLHVAAAGLGCAPFTRHPIIVFLDRAPADVFVTASAAL